MSRLKRALVPLKPVLLVAPENIHPQLDAEWKKRFGITVTKLDSQDTFLRMTQKVKQLPAGFYISSYFQLGLNKIYKPTVPNKCDRNFPAIARVMFEYGVSLDDAKEFQLNRDLEPGENALMEKALAACQERYDHFSQGVGDERNGIRCIFGPSLVDLIHGQFGCVSFDEGIRLKSEDGIISNAIRNLDPPFRLVLTATPVKNRLKDIFYLLHWSAGGSDKPTAKFPYADGEQERFTADFCVCERNLTQELKKKGEHAVKRANRKGKKPRGRPGVEVCSIHRLWKLIAPIVLRRRKSDIGEDIVKKTKHIIRAPMGFKQHKVYKYHLEADYLDKNGQSAMMAKLQALRSVAAAPTSALLQLQDDNVFGMHRSNTDYIPKLAACLTILEQRMREGEQSVVFSALHEPLDALSKRLTEARVPHEVLDGRKSAVIRGRLAMEFQKGLAKGASPILLAGLRAMGEGNSWPLANNVILLAYDWAYDAFEQGINRCHRLDSVKDVNVWPIICTGSIDRKLESQISEKADAAELTIDGRLIGEDVQEVSLRDLLKMAQEEFREATVLKEEQLEEEWPALRAKLTEAWCICQDMTRERKPRKAVMFHPICHSCNAHGPFCAGWPAACPADVHYPPTDASGAEVMQMIEKPNNERTERL
jgi:hypothetical protein